LEIYLFKTVEMDRNKIKGKIRCFACQFSLCFKEGKILKIRKKLKIMRL